MSRTGADEIASGIKRSIHERSCKAGDKLPSVAQVMELFGGSPATCLKAYKTLEKEGLVESFQGKGFFLKKSESLGVRLKRVGLLTMEYRGELLEREAAFASFMKSAGDELRRRSAAVVRLEKEDLYSPGAKDVLNGLDAIISTSGCVDERTVPLLEGWGRPVAVIQHEETLPYRMHQVVPDLRSGFLKAVELFAKYGVKKITIASNNIQTHYFRTARFVDALRESPAGRGIETETVEFERMPADLGRLTGRALGERILKEGRSIEAIFSPSDFLAFGIMDCFLSKGLKPGADFRLAGYDNIEGEGLTPYGVPLLTSVEFPRDRIARQAVALLESLGDEGDEATRVFRMPCEIVERASTDGSIPNGATMP